MSDLPHDAETGGAGVPYAPIPVPETLETYQEIGPFSGENLPKGLLKDHRLKAGSWGRLTILEGAIRFIWSDGRTDNVTEDLSAGDVLMIPPQALHNLEKTGDFLLKIAFMKQA